MSIKRRYIDETYRFFIDDGLTLFQSHSKDKSEPFVFILGGVNVYFTQVTNINNTVYYLQPLSNIQDDLQSK